MKPRMLLALLVSLALVMACREAPGEVVAAGPAKAPTVCPTPKPGEGNQLQVDFTGVLLFKSGTSPDPPFRVIIPFLGDHTAYIQYETADLAMPPEGFNAPGDLDKCCGRDYILLANHQLEIQGDDEHGELQKGAIDQFVIHLKSLTGVDKLNPDYDKSTPAAGFVAAQMDLRRGALTPLLPDDKKTWIFKHKNEQFKKDPVCLAQGVRLALTLKPGSVVKIVSSNAGATLSLKAHDDRPTLVRIGNSMKEDILCPIPTADSDDPHFRNFYRMLTRQPAKPWTPEKTEQKCYAPALKARMAVKVGILSHHGSNCIPAQWP